MISGLVLLYTIAVILIVIFSILVSYAVKFLMAVKKQKKIAAKYTKMIEERTQKEFNKIATLSPADLNAFLARVYQRFLVLAAETDAVPSEPNNTEILYTEATARLLEYLGDETVEAINYYYGKDYVVRWSNYAYRNLVSAGIVSELITNKTTKRNVEMYL